MKTSVWVFSIILCVLVVLVEFDVNRRSTKLTSNSKVKKNEIAKTEAPAIPVLKKDLNQLAKIMTDTKANEDQRSEAVELIAGYQTVESLQQLEDFVVQKNLNVKNELESALKAQAIEGIAAYPQKELALSSLNSINPKVSELFLKERIKKSMTGLKMQNSESVDDTDSNALKTLVE